MDVLHRLQGALSTTSARAAAKLSTLFHAFAVSRRSWASDLRLHQGRRLTLVFAPLLLTIIVSGLLAVRSFRDLLDDERFVADAHVVGFQVTDVERASDHAEIDQRNYLLTGDAKDLAAYTAERAAIGAAIVQLQVLTANDAPQRYRTTKLNAMIVERLAELQQANDLRAQQRTADAVAVMRSAKSTQTLESLDATLAKVHDVEDQRIHARLDAASNRFFEGQRPLLAAMIIDILLLTVLFALIRDAFIAREHLLGREQKAHAEAQAAIMLRDQFLSISSHELRTPITTLLPTVEILERQLSRTLPLDERLRQSIATMYRQVARLQTLIATMLDVTRIERGQLTIANDPLDLASLVRTIVDEVQLTTQMHSIELIAPCGTILVRGDAVRLSQVLFNLLQNAIKYSPDGGTIRVDMTRTPREVAVSVTDHGMGIPPDAVPHLFERFYRAPPVRSEHISGMGVGLYVVGEIVALHGGEVTVSSTEGVGSTFTVRLPINAAEESAADAAGSTPTDDAGVTRTTTS